MSEVNAFSGRGLAAPEFNLPSLQDLSESTARRLVDASPLQGLMPDMPGVSSKTWQELAAVATQLPDIRWLGRQVFMWCGKPEEDLWNDFAMLHKDQCTDLENPQHRDHFGEKVLRYGGIDLVLRTLALFRPEERIGHRGVLTLFAEPLQGRTRSILHYSSRTEFFLRRENFAKYVEPRLGHSEGDWAMYAEEGRQVTPQKIANTMLVFAMPPSTPRKLQAFRLVAQTFGACLAASVSDMASCLYITSSGWDELFWTGDARSAARVLWYLCEDTRAPAFPVQARGQTWFAELLLQAQHALVDRDLDDYELEAEGPDAQDPMRLEEFTFPELVRRCVVRRAFVNAGLELLCQAVGLDFLPQPEGPEEELHRQATAQEKQAMAALATVCLHLAEDCRTAKRLRAA